MKSIDANKSLVDKINKYGKELDIPDSDKESVIYLAVTNVNDQWNSMKTQTQEKLRTLLVCIKLCLLVFLHKEEIYQ